MLSITELLLFVFLAVGILWVLALVDILKGEFKGNDKLIWIIIVAVLPVLGAILYFVIGKNQKVGGRKGGATV
jgi:uncharacterized RDD family membrane protein YckC